MKNINAFLVEDNICPWDTSSWGENCTKTQGGILWGLYN